MRNPLGLLNARRTIWHNDVLGGDEHRHLAPQARVVVDLLERGTCQRQRPQQTLMLRTIFSHHLGELVVHVLFDPQCSFLAQFADSTHNLGLDRPHGGECLHHGFGLEAHNRLGEHRVEHATSALPRLGALFILQAQQLQAINVGLNPLFAVTNVFVEIGNQLGTQ